MLPPEAMVKFWPMLPLRSISRPIALKQQVSVSMFVAHMQISLVWAVSWDQVDVQGFTELALLLTGFGTRGSCPSHLPAAALG